MMVALLPSLMGALIHQVMVVSGFRTPALEALVFIVAAMTAAWTAVSRFRSLRDPDKDPMTGLLNKRFFEEALKKYFSPRRYAPPVGVVFLDIDNFKKINDGSGHAAGDMVLRAVAERLHAALRTLDIVARLGGDEFGMLLVDIFPDVKVLEAVAKRLLDEVGKPILYQGEKIAISLSIGIGLWDRRVPPDEIMRRVDAALYRAKRSGKNCYAIAEGRQ
ncbi:MAG: GGDEF domain-containing protein [Candidatus Wildermuthbacteria bacterium]|nr:GGDEF domain-containing protein [Candidatus Wildermuthbacteria bacterium]MBI2647890.1 GGDEF domain-containing protein [Candidatus Wildermuthbacteria bacterium]